MAVIKVGSQDKPATQAKPNKTVGEAAAKQIKIVEIINQGDKLLLPEDMSLEEAVQSLQRQIKANEEMILAAANFDYHPYDTANAIMRVLEAEYGYIQQEKTPGIFGPTPPVMVDVENGVNSSVKVPWGSLSLPGVNGTLQITYAHSATGVQGSLTGKITKGSSPVFDKIVQKVRDYLKDNSLYMHKAIRVTFSDYDNNELELPIIKFIDTQIDRSALVYSDDVTQALETNLFTPIRRRQDLAANGIPFKRGVLLGGPFGTGKTLAARYAGALSQAHGMTFMYVTKAVDLPFALRFASRNSSNGVVMFCEDIDRTTNGNRTADIDSVLNTLDGVDTKSMDVLLVLTTNDIESINKAMLRPGRLDAVINVQPPDAKAVESLVRLYAGHTVRHDQDLSAVGMTLAGNIPATIAEVVKRAKLAQLSMNQPGELVEHLSNDALIAASRSMKHQLELLHGVTVEVTVPTIEQRLEIAIEGIEKIKSKVAELE
jgi:transitional endoplasmic reticulum ATPase